VWGERIRGGGGKKGGKEIKKRKKIRRAIWTFYNLDPTGEAVLPNVFQK
jgi:hypothetical protein